MLQGGNPKQLAFAKNITKKQEKNVKYDAYISHKNMLYPFQLWSAISNVGQTNREFQENRYRIHNHPLFQLHKYYLYYRPPAEIYYKSPLHLLPTHHHIYALHKILLHRLFTM